MAYGLSNGHVTDDVTWPPKVLWGSTVGYPCDSLSSCVLGPIRSVWYVYTRSQAGQLSTCCWWLSAVSRRVWRSSLPPWHVAPSAPDDSTPQPYVNCDNMIKQSYEPFCAFWTTSDVIMTRPLKAKPRPSHNATKDEILFFGVHLRTQFNNMQIL